MNKIKLSPIDRLEVENAILKATIAKQFLDNLIEKKAITQGIVNLNEWTFDFMNYEFNEIEKPKNEVKEEKK